MENSVNAPITKNFVKSCFYALFIKINFLTPNSCTKYPRTKV